MNVQIQHLYLVIKVPILLLIWGLSYWIGIWAVSAITFFSQCFWFFAEKRNRFLGFLCQFAKIRHSFQLDKLSEASVTGVS
jgi:hypothetical protein